MAKARAKSKGKIAEVFQKRTIGLADDAQGIADALDDVDKVRPWQVASTENGPLDIPHIRDDFDRDQLNSDYAELVADQSTQGTTGDAIATKIQLDYVAGMERGYRARHASPIRCLIHAAARRKGHGHPQGIFKSGVLSYPQDTIRAGSS